VLNTLPRNATRADVGSYSELVSTAFRAGLGEDCMDLITELLTVQLKTVLYVPTVLYVLKTILYLLTVLYIDCLICAEFAPRPSARG